MRKLIAKLSFSGSMLFVDDLAGIHMSKTNVNLDQLVYVSMAILEMSKHLITAALSPFLGLLRGSPPLCPTLTLKALFSTDSPATSTLKE